MINFEEIKSKLNFDELYNKFLWLDKKQQAVVVGVLLVVFVVVMILPVNWISSQLNAQEEEYKEVVVAAGKLYAKLEAYDELKKSIGDSTGKKASLRGDPLKKIVYETIDKIGLDQHKATLKTNPSVTKGDFIEEAKEITILNIDFDQTIQMLDQLIHYPDVPVSVSKLNLKSDRRNKNRLNRVVMTVTLLKPAASN